MASIDLDWISAIPGEHQTKMTDILNHPPGTSGYDIVYESLFKDKFIDGHGVLLEDMNLTEREESEIFGRRCRDNQSLDHRRDNNGERVSIDKGVNSGCSSLQQKRQLAYAWGKYAEALIARRIVTSGLPLREWDWRPGKGKGEIDLITQRGNRMIFIEVKARCGKNSDPYYAITPRKIKELCHGADIYLKMQRETYEYQFDVALVRGDYLDYEIEYIEDAFMAPLRTNP